MVQRRKGMNGNSCVDGVEPCTLVSPLKCVHPVEAPGAGWKMSPMGSCSASVSPAGLEEELLSQLPLFIFFRGLLKRGLPSPARWRLQFSVRVTLSLKVTSLNFPFSPTQSQLVKRYLGLRDYVRQRCVHLQGWEEPCQIPHAYTFTHTPIPDEV